MISKIFHLFAPCWAVNLLFRFKLSKLDKRRIVEINEWITCAEYVAKTTGHVEAKTIVSFLRESMFHAAPTVGGFKAIRATPQMLVPVTILLPEDAGVGGIWATQLNMSDKAFANHVRDRNGKFAVLSLKGFVGISDFAKGIICLHEGKHALHHFRDDFRMGVVSAEEELAVLEFECRLVELYLGGEYTLLIDSGVDLIESLRIKNGRIPRERDLEPVFAEIFRMFDLPTDGVEERLLHSNIAFALMFRHIEKYDRSNARSEKLRLVSSMHGVH